MFVKAPFQTESQILLFGEGFPIETDWMGEVDIGQHIGPRQHLMTRRGGRASTLQAPSVNEESIAGALFVK